jgi:hypothetical protein
LIQQLKLLKIILQETAELVMKLRLQMTIPSPTTGKILISLLSHSSVDVLCFKAAVHFVQANLHFEWKLLFINVVSFHFVECKKNRKKLDSIQIPK